jgi:hypothetical protein
MADGGYKIAKHKATGEWWRVRVHEDGTTEPIEAISAEPAAAPEPTSPSPMPDVAPPAPAPAPVADPEVSMWQRFMDMGNSAIQTADDAAGAFMRTDLTDQIGAPIGAKVASWMHDLPADEPGSVVVNSDPRDMILKDARMREARSPYATAAGDVAQSMGGGMLFGPQNAAAPVAARMAAGAGEAALLGGAQRVGSAGPEMTDEEVFEEDLAGTGPEAAIGAAIPGAGAAMSAVARPVARAAGPFASRMRAAAPGGYGAELKKLANREGLEYTDRELGEEIERLIPPKMMPRSPRDYADEAGPLLERARMRSGEAIDEATGAGVTAPLRGQPDDVGVMEGLDSAVGRARGMHGSTNKAYGRAIERERALVEGDFPGSPDQRLSARQLQDVKLGLEEGGWPSSPLASVRDSAAARAQRDASAAPREALDFAMRGRASDDVVEKWLASKRDIGPLSEIEEMSRNRAAQESGNQLMSLPSSIAFAGGGALGGSALGGAEGGLLGAGAGLMSLAATEGVKRYGRDGLANVARGTQRAAGNAAQRVPGAAEAGIAGITSALADTYEPDEQQQPAAPQTQAEAGGEHPATWAVKQAFESGSADRYFGRFAPELQKALDSGSKADLSATILRLQSDPEFVREVMPTINAAMNRGQQRAQ